MSASYILSIDQGTTSSRAIIFSNAGEVVSSGQHSFEQIYPQPGWVEHNPHAIWDTVYRSAQDALNHASLNAHDISAIGITNQRETVIMWDKKTGEPVANAIVWQDRRTAEKIDALCSASDIAEEVASRSGLVMNAYFSASKIGWLLDNISGLRTRAQAGEIAFGTVDSWLVYKLTNGASHITDASNASRTLLYNIHKNQWDESLLSLFDIPASILPEIVPSSGMLAQCDASLFGAAIPITAIAGDQQAATFGHLCTEKGSAKNTYGTGCFLVTPTENSVVPSSAKLLSTVAWRIGEHVSYAQEGSIFAAGAAINWAATHMGLGDNGAELSALASTVEHTGGVYFVPALAGLGAPHWDHHAQGTWLGISAATTRAHMARAVLEGIAFQVQDMIIAMNKDLPTPLSHLKVDGGVCNSDILLQFQADISNITICRPDNIEATAQGVAYLAGLAIGIWHSIDDLHALKTPHTEFSPKMDEKTRDNYYQNWKNAVTLARTWGKMQHELSPQTEKNAA